jgi:hypothetical protein
MPALACLYLHPWEFVEMPSVVETGEASIVLRDFLWKNAGQVALGELDALIRRLRQSDARFHTMRSFHAAWGNRLASLL